MKGDITIQAAVKSASRVSKRQGKWANLAEIKSKAPTFKEPLSPVLSYLVHNARIEKKKADALWRPRAAGYSAEHGKSGSREGGGRTEGGRSGGGRTDGRTSTRSSGGREAVARGVAGSAVSSSLSSSVNRMLF